MFFNFQGNKFDKISLTLILSKAIISLFYSKNKKYKFKDSTKTLSIVL